MPPRSSTSFCSGSRSITGIRRLGIHLGRVRAVEPDDVARELGDGDVHAEADAEIRDLVARARRGRRGSSPPSRASRSRRGRARRRPSRAARRASSSDMSSASTQRTRTRAAVVDARVLERLVHREVGVLQLHVLADERDLDDARAARRCARSARPTRRGRPRPRSSPSFSQTSRSRPSLLERLRARGRRRGRRGSRSPRSASTSAKSAILSRMSRESASCERQTMTSGWIPMRRSSLTECCVGFVFSSPAVSMNGTSVTWM